MTAARRLRSFFRSVLRSPWPAVLGSLLLAACRPDLAALDGRDESLPLLARAAEAARLRDEATAVTLYRRALDAHPGAAKGHLDFAIFLHDVRKSYVDAIYHYYTYLRLRPGTDKRHMIEERIRLARQSFAARELPEHRDAARVMARLEAENGALRTRIAELERQQAARRTPVSAADPAAPPDDRAPADGTPTYVVRAGDTLSSIAVRVYGDPARWRDIVEANRDTLNGGDTIKVGQTLVLP